MVAAIYCVALFGPLVIGLYWRRASERGALLAMVTSGLAGLAWRGFGLERDTGIHMLNVALPLSVAALVVGSLAGGGGANRGAEISGLRPLTGPEDQGRT